MWDCLAPVDPVPIVVAVQMREGRAETRFRRVLEGGRLLAPQLGRRVVVSYLFPWLTGKSWDSRTSCAAATGFRDVSESGTLPVWPAENDHPARRNLCEYRSGKRAAPPPKCRPAVSLQEFPGRQNLPRLLE